MQAVTTDNIFVQKRHSKKSSLFYLDDTSFGIERRNKEKTFYYQYTNGDMPDTSTVQRIENLKIPPAWHDVWISPYDNSHLQAYGRDEKERKQYIYHENWMKMMQESKFHRIEQFSKKLPYVREIVTKKLAKKSFSLDTVIATCIWLLDHTFIRIGNFEYMRKNKSYGLTTLRHKHVKVRKNGVALEFVGKSNINQSIQIFDKKIIRVIKKSIELPGYQLFQYKDKNGNKHIIDSSQVNEFIKNTTGEDFSAKDFRTWGGTLLAATYLYYEKEPANNKERKKNVTQAVKAVSQRLGNTPSVCRKYYIHPTVLKSYFEGDFQDKFKRCLLSSEACTNFSKVEHALSTYLVQ